MGGAGTDKASYRYATTGVTIELLDPAANGGPAAGTSFDSVENFDGSNSDDVIKGDGAANEIAGLAGDDRLTGNGGDDRLEGG
ncbi:MAG TPA: hypothetical protein ENK26_10335, partial [Gammaproteobacteria bacterium]|nr:hypothetical protein [Gammaproteobacteria bacterium]